MAEAGAIGSPVVVERSTIDVVGSGERYRRPRFARALSVVNGPKAFPMRLNQTAYVAVGKDFQAEFAH